MPLPIKFSDFEHLQDMIRLNHNKVVKDYFGDLNGADGSWEPEITTTRGQLRTACTMKDTDTGDMTLMRMLFFYETLGYARSNLSIFYGSKENQEPPVIGHPKIVFYFSQDAQSVPNESHKADAEYSVRLMQLENTSTNLRTKLIEIANEIKVQFVDAKKGIILTKGRLCVSYKDPKNGFPNGSKILTNSEADAIDIYKRICNAVDVPYSEQNITLHNPKKPSTIGLSSGTQVIMGKTRKKRAYRRVVNVRFRYAYALIPGEPQPVFLVDTTQRYLPLVQI